MARRSHLLLCGTLATAGCNGILDIQAFPPGPDSSIPSSGGSDSGGDSSVDSTDASTLEISSDAAKGGSPEAGSSQETSLTEAPPTADSSGDVALPGDAAPDSADASACSLGGQRCNGSSVQSCLANGNWSISTPCDAGFCNGAGVCGECANGSTKCSGNDVQTCIGGQWGMAAACGGAEACSGSACVVQLTATAAMVTATVGLPVIGTVAFVHDTSAADTAGSNWTASVDWGDGSATSYGTLSGASGTFTVAATHTYQAFPASGSSNVTVTVTAPSGAKASVTYVATLRPPSTATVTEFSIPTANAGPLSIVAGADNAMWFTENALAPGKIGRVVTTGAQTGSISEYSVSGKPYGIASDTGSGAVLRFTEAGTPSNGAIGTMALTGALLYEAPLSTFYQPLAIARDSLGNFWFTDGDGAHLGKIDASNTVHEYPLPSSYVDTYGIVATSSGIWFTDDVGAVDLLSPPATSAVQFSGYSATGSMMAIGPNGTIWFLENGLKKLGYVDPTTQHFTELAIPTATGGTNQGIVEGPDGNMWYTVPDRLARVTPTGAVTEFPAPTSASFPAGIAVGPDGNLWFAESGANKIARISP